MTEWRDRLRVWGLFGGIVGGLWFYASLRQVIEGYDGRHPPAGTSRLVEALLWTPN